MRERHYQNYLCLREEPETPCALITQIIFTVLNTIPVPWQSLVRAWCCLLWLFPFPIPALFRAGHKLSPAKTY